MGLLGAAFLVVRDFTKVDTKVWDPSLAPGPGLIILIDGLNYLCIVKIFASTANKLTRTILA